LLAARKSSGGINSSRISSIATKVYSRPSAVDYLPVDCRHQRRLLLLLLPPPLVPKLCGRDAVPLTRRHCVVCLHACVVLPTYRMLVHTQQN
jgi:hypothetical protein